MKAHLFICALVGTALLDSALGAVTHRGGAKATRKPVKFKNKGDSPRKSEDGKAMRFPPTMQFDLVTDTETMSFEASSASIQGPIETVSNQGRYGQLNMKNRQLYTGSNGENFIVSAKEDSAGNVVASVTGRLSRPGGAMWVNGDALTTFEDLSDVSPGEPFDIVEGPTSNHSSFVDPNNPSFESPGAEIRRRRRRSFPTVDEYDTTNTIEVGVLGDGAWMEKFRRFAPDEATAVEEASLYVTLLCAEVSRFYRSLKTVSEASDDIDDIEVVVYCTGLVYPEPGEEWNFVSNAKIFDDDQFVNYYNGVECASVDEPCENVLDGFRMMLYKSIRGDQFPFQWDHFIHLTGYKIQTFGRTGIIGVSSLLTMCFPEEDKYRSSSINTDTIYNSGALVSHEIGHSLGAYHDGQYNGAACTSCNNVMCPVLYIPSVFTKDNYYDFSTCSVQQFVTHLNSMKLAGRECLKDTQSSPDDFKDMFCAGFNQGFFDIDYQCSLRFDMESTACGVTTTDDGRRLVRETACWQLYTVSCSQDGQYCQDNALLYVLPGTPCSGPDPSQDYVCYRGECVPEPTVCDGWTSSNTVGSLTKCDCSGLDAKRKGRCCRKERSSDGSCCLDCMADGQGDCTIVPT